MSHLPEQLRHLVDFLGTQLGDSIRKTCGPHFYEQVEDVRQKAKSASSAQDFQSLMNQLSRLSADERFRMAHSFSVLLELMNSAEAAFRSLQLRKRQSVEDEVTSDTVIQMVMTAHPTESRSIQLVRNSDLMVQLLSRYLEASGPGLKERIQSQVEKFWLESLSKSEKPEVTDEADYIYEITLNPKILRYILSDDAPANVQLITWVGGDKDGHPLIDEKVMLQSMRRSRLKLLHAVEVSFRNLQAHLESEVVIGQKTKNLRNTLSKKIDELLKSQVKIQQLKPLDGRRTMDFISKTFKILSAVETIFPHSYETVFIRRLIGKFPMLVMPLEIREDAGVVAEALENPKLPIYRMLKAIDALAAAQSVHHYAKGLILSHTESASDIENGFRLLKKFKFLRTLPVVPLFETSSALKKGPQILQELLQKEPYLNHFKKNSEAKLEVMVGYSDSSKEFGALPSRKKIRDGIQKMEKVLESFGLQPIFFHGSGGSVARGGGSVQEQIAWWPLSCRKQPKMTIQGEMVHRTFARPEILHSYLSRFRKEETLPLAIDEESTNAFEKFIAEVENAYRGFVGAPELLGTALKATPYNYLDQLKLGSRPAKRPSAEVSVSGLRAIPWVLCWTQARILFPAWWGMGSAWENLSETERKSLKRFQSESPLWGSYVKLLGFTLAKVELPIWNTYLDAFLPRKDAENLKQMFLKEYRLATDMVKALSGSSDLVWYKPWLAESIQMRSKYITPLNMLQILSMQEHDGRLLRECATGIACGMMTTG